MIQLPEKTADNVTILIYRLTQTDADLVSIVVYVYLDRINSFYTQR